MTAGSESYLREWPCQADEAAVAAHIVTAAASEETGAAPSASAGGGSASPEARPSCLEGARRELLPEEAASDAETVPGGDAVPGVAKDVSAGLPRSGSRLARARRSRTSVAGSVEKAIEEEDTVKAFSLSDLQEAYGDAVDPDPAGQPLALLAKSTSVATRFFDEEMEQSVLEMESLPPSQQSSQQAGELVETIEVHDTQECICVAVSEPGAEGATLGEPLIGCVAIDVERSSPEAAAVQRAPSAIWVTETQESSVVVGDDPALEEVADALQVELEGAMLVLPPIDVASPPDVADEASLPMPPGDDTAEGGVFLAATERDLEDDDTVEGECGLPTVPTLEEIEDAWEAGAQEPAQDANDAFTLEFNRRLDFVREREKRRRLATF